MPVGDSPLVARRRVRLALREAREAAGLTQTYVSEEMEWSPAKVIRIENGDVGISPNDLEPPLGFLAVTDRTPVKAAAPVVELSDLTGDDDPAHAVLYREDCITDNVHEDPVDIGCHRANFDELWHVALDDRGTVELIFARMKDLPPRNRKGVPQCAITRNDPRSRGRPRTRQGTAPPEQRRPSGPTPLQRKRARPRNPRRCPLPRI